jgi:2-dehydropantoate 2-reductase
MLAREVAMKVLMLGRGVIASVYGWAFDRAGHDVEFYVRPSADHPDEVKLDLLDLRRRPWGRSVRERWPITLRREIPLRHEYDLIVVSVGHHRLREAMELLAPRVGAATVLVFGNVWPRPEAVTAGVPTERVVWGFPGAGGGFQPDGTLLAGLLPGIRMHVQGPRAEAVRALFRSAGVRVRDEPDIHGWLAIHFALDAGMHAQGLRLGSLSRIVGDTRSLREALLTGRELLPMTEASGVDLSRHRIATLPARRARAIAPMLGWAITHLAAARRSLEAHTDPRSEEVRAVCRDALAAAREHGIPAPRLEAVEELFAR